MTDKFIDYRKQLGRTELKIRNKQLEKHVATDALMQIASRTEVENRISEIVNSNLPATMLMMDLDYFKKVNDTLGHDGGDRILEIIGNRLKKMVSMKDSVGRWGGEEFVLIMEGDIEIGTLKKRAEDIRLQFENNEISYDGKKVNLTMSIGLAKRENNELAKEWFKRADVALYTAKESGRNRVIVAQSV